MPADQDDELVMTLVTRALALPSDEREALLASTCSQHPELYEIAHKYVQWEERMKGFLQAPLVRVLKLERPFETGEILQSRFRIVREVARGGMGVVYEAIDQRLERRIALKCARPGHGGRLPPEVRNASDISHPNVCRIFEIHTASTEHGTVDFLTMEFLEGETLATKIRRRQLQDREAQTVALQLCAGLAEAHRKGVVHGDLKSSNVIVTTEADGAVRAVITDFGLARRPHESQITEHAAETVGTPDYMAPELWQGAKPSVASDVYALGMILEELASGKVSPTREQRLTRTESSIPGRWQRVIERCLNRDPELRYQNAGEVAQALRPPSLRWMAAIGAAAVFAAATSAIAYRTAAVPRDTVRLAMLPFASAPGSVGVAAELSRSASEQLSRLKSGTRTRVAFIPLAKSLGERINTVDRAGAVLGATHVLHGTLNEDNDRLIVQAYLTDTRSGVNTKEWKAVYTPQELRYVRIALAGVVTGALRLPAVAELGNVNMAARQDYDVGLLELRQNSTIDSGLARLERAARADPESPLTHAALAEALWWKYFLTGEKLWLDRAAESLRQAEQRNPDLAEVHRAAGLFNTSRGWYDQAEAHYLRAIELDPRNGDAHRRLGNVYNTTKAGDKAVLAYLRAIELDPEQYRNHQALGAFYNDRGDYEEALKHFQKTVELAPKEPIARFVFGDNLRQMGRFAEAERELRLAQVLGETSTVLNALGVVLMYLGRDQEAVQYFMQALNRYPERYLWWMNLGTAYRRLNLLTDAERANRRGLALAEADMRKNPKNGYIRAHMAYLYAGLGQRARAESEIAQALELAPGDSDVHRAAVKTYEVLRRREASLEVLGYARMEVLADVNRYPDLADLRTDPRFKKMIAARQGK